MNQDHKVSYSFLDIPLSPDNPNELMEQLVEAESKAYYATTQITLLETTINKLEQERVAVWADAMNQHQDKKLDLMKAEAVKACAELQKSIDDIDAKITFFKQVVKLIDRRCSIGQSILANITSQIKAGINL